MKKSLILSVLFVFPIFVSAQVSNLGIIKGIWFGEDQYFVGDTIRVYTAIHNHSGDDIEGTVEFFDNGNSIGTKDFTVLDHRISELWVDTDAKEGEHIFSVLITEVQKDVPGVGEESVIPRVIESDNLLVIELDTDGDNIPDREDDDDDNDGYSDQEEIDEGTDPLDINDYPQDRGAEEEKSNEDSGKSIVHEILSLFNYTDDLEDEDLDNEEKIVPEPEFITNLENSYPAIAPVTDSINHIQNILVPTINKAQNSNIEEIRLFRDTRASQELEPDTKKNSFYYWLLQIYGLILAFLKWVFSCLICMIILLFIMLHLLIRILFAVGRRFLVGS